MSDDMNETAASIIARLQGEVSEKTAEIQKLQQQNIVGLFRARIDAYEAETERMKVVGAPTPNAAKVELWRDVPLTAGALADAFERDYPEFASLVKEAAGAYRP